MFTPFPVSINGGSGVLVTGAITAGGTARIFGATPADGYEVLNSHLTETLYINEGGTATVADNSTSIPIGPRVPPTIRLPVTN